jgi:hypothetical protein
MSSPIRLLLCLLLIVAPTLSAQAPAASPAQTPAVPVMKSWFIRLIPPRPTFDNDMSDAEQKLME